MNNTEYQLFTDVCRRCRRRRRGSVDPETSRSEVLLPVVDDMAPSGGRGCGSPEKCAREFWIGHGLDVVSDVEARAELAGTYT